MHMTYIFNSYILIFITCLIFNKKPGNDIQKQTVKFLNTGKNKHEKAESRSYDTIHHYQPAYQI